MTKYKEGYLISNGNNYYYLKSIVSNVGYNFVDSTSFNYPAENNQFNEVDRNFYLKLITDIFYV